MHIIWYCGEILQYEGTIPDDLSELLPYLNDEERVPDSIIPRYFYQYNDETKEMEWILDDVTHYALFSISSRYTSETDNIIDFENLESNMEMMFGDSLDYTIYTNDNYYNSYTDIKFDIDDYKKVGTMENVLYNARILYCMREIDLDFSVMDDGMDYRNQGGRLVSGDANVNRKVDISDVVAVRRYILNPDSYGLGYAARQAADIVGNDDGVNAQDAVAIQKMILGIA